VVNRFTGAGFERRSRPGQRLIGEGERTVLSGAKVLVPSPDRMLPASGIWRKEVFRHTNGP
jgi:hypothetical protein